jgi:hypothetical protein
MDGLFALPGQLFEDGPSRWVSECAEDVIGIGRRHIKTIAKWLWVCQKKNAISSGMALRDFSDRGGREGVALRLQ